MKRREANARSDGDDVDSPKKKKKQKPSYHTTLDADVLIEAKIQCLREGRDLNEVIEELLKKWLEGLRSQPPP